MWWFGDQLDPAARETDGFLIGKATDRGVRSLLEIVRGTFVVSTALKVHRELHRHLTRAFTVNFFTPICYQPVHLRASCLGQTFIQNVLIQSVYKAVARRHFSVREFVNAAVLDVLSLARELDATFFHVERIFFESRCQRECRK